MLENFILNELRDLGFSIKYWRTSGKAEVDFIVELQNQLVPVEVKSFGKIKRGFLSFINTYKPKNAIVFTENEFTIKRINNTRIAFLPHFFI